MIIILSGAPGAGKGTQGDYLKERLGFLKISTGDLLRKHVKEKSQIGLLAQQYMDRGDLVPDEILLEIIKIETNGIDQRKIIVLDGYPRTVGQANSLDGVSHKVKAFINLEVESEELVKRLSARRVCGGCGWTCHLYEAPPRLEGKCDRCGGLLEQRSDDQPESIRNRLNVFSQKTAPVMEFYKGKKLHIGVLGTGHPEVVHKRVLESLKDLGLEVNRKLV